MRILLHVLYTWSLAVSIFLAGLVVYHMIVFPEAWNYHDVLNIHALIILGYSLIAFLPSYLFCLLFFYLIHNAASNPEKLFLWILSSLIAGVLNIGLLLLIYFPNELNAGIFLFLWPVYIAIFFSIVIRISQFFKIQNKST